MQAQSSIFKAYDIRGIVPSTLDRRGGRSAGPGVRQRRPRRGRKDGGRRPRWPPVGPVAVAALIRGLVATGVDVIDVGVVTTPMLYFAANTLCSSGIQVTGSHNPKDYNGFKMVLAGRAIYGDEIQGLRKTMETGKLAAPGGGRSATSTSSRLPRPHRRSDIKLARPMKIVVDCGNGVAGASAPAIFRAIGCEVIELFSEVDGNFPNHHPDPEQAREPAGPDRQAEGERRRARAGLRRRRRPAGHRHQGRQQHLPGPPDDAVRPDVLSRVPGGTILFDVKCTQRLAPAIARPAAAPDVQDRPLADQGQDEGRSARRWAAR
jgi:phosphomannomutase